MSRTVLQSHIFNALAPELFDTHADHFGESDIWQLAGVVAEQLGAHFDAALTEAGILPAKSVGPTMFKPKYPSGAAS